MPEEMQDTELRVWAQETYAWLQILHADLLRLEEEQGFKRGDPGDPPGPPPNGDE
jgi:hypothetical protein